RLPVPLVAHPEELVGAERILDGVVDDRHERNDGGQRDQREHRNDEPERLVVLRLAHPSSSTRHESAKMPMRIGLNEMRGSAGISAPSRSAIRKSTSSRRACTIFTRPMSSIRPIDTGAPSRPSAMSSGRTPSSILPETGARGADGNGNACAPTRTVAPETSAGMTFMPGEPTKRPTKV